MVDLFSDEIFGEWGPGIHYHMPEDDYHAIKAVSNSSLKHAKISMRHFYEWLISGPIKKTAPMRWGTIQHLATFQKDIFDKEVVLTTAKDKRCKAYKEALEANPDAKHVLTAPEVELVTAMVTELQNTPECIRLIKDGIPEVTIFTTDPETGLKVKLRMDLTPTDPEKPFILDYKTTTNAKPAEFIEGSMKVIPSEFEKQAYRLGYCNQGAFYLKYARLMRIAAEFYAILAQEKESPYLAVAYVYGHETLDAAREENSKLMTSIAKCAKAKVWPGYTNKIETMGRPWWGMKDD